MWWINCLRLCAVWMCKLQQYKMQKKGRARAQVGKRADFVVLADSPVSPDASCAPPAVLQTYVDGRCAFGCRAVAAAA